MTVRNQFQRSISDLEKSIKQEVLHHQKCYSVLILGGHTNRFATQFVD
jgi:hypothetical protein